jgi:hypothetical protein
MHNDTIPNKLHGIFIPTGKKCGIAEMQIQAICPQLQAAHGYTFYCIPSLLFHIYHFAEASAVPENPESGTIVESSGFRVRPWPGGCGILEAEGR